jgi:hypothetical protein
MITGGRIPPIKEMTTTDAKTQYHWPIVMVSGQSDDALVVKNLKIKKELFFAQTENAKLKNQLHQAKGNLAREWAEPPERGSKGKKGFQEDEGGSK